jgi:hypothetical protein
LFEVLDVDGKTIYKMKDKYKKAKRKFRAA